MAERDVLIRDAAESDLPQIVLIYNMALSARLARDDSEPATLADRYAWFHEHQPGYRPLWVAEVNGSVTGWLSFQTLNGRPAYVITAELSVYVSDVYQRRGVATALLGKAIEQAPALGLRNLVGFIWGHNEPSLRLFESLGFSRWGFFPTVAEMHGRELDLVVMGLKLAP